MAIQSRAQAVVIGGGIVGCSIFYHLTKLGWKDVLLLERSELTSGSTWHAAAANLILHDVANMLKIQHYTVMQYEALEAETGQSCGIHPCGGLYLANTPERWDQIRILHSRARLMGLESELLTPEQCREKMPVLNIERVIGGMFEPKESHVDPNGVPHAYAKGGKMNGGKVHRFCPVTETNQLPDGTWEVVTGEGTVIADVVVNAAGLWAREVGKLAGLDIPLMPMEHQYMVTESIPAIEALEKELPILHDSDMEFYTRQEGQGLLFGAYENEGHHVWVDGTPLDFGHELFPDALDRMEDNIMQGMERIPCMADAGVRRVVNGPMIWSPDALPLIGPMPEVKNYYIASGVMAGFSQSGGLGKLLAEWIVEGAPSLDIFFLDPARFGSFANRNYVLERTEENYSTRFRIIFPNDERPAGRPNKTRPIYDRQKERGAVFGALLGWEYPLWFAPEGMAARDENSFRRANWFDVVGGECKATRETVGLLDTSIYGRYVIEGPNAEAWLDRLVTNKVPTKIGRVALCPMLNEKGGVIGDFTVTRLSAERFLLIGAGVAEIYHKRWFDRFLPADGVRYESWSDSHGGFSISGPNARKLLGDMTGEDVSHEAFPFLTSREMNIGPARCIVMRVSFTGEAGYEIYMPASQQTAVYDRILTLGEKHGLKEIGIRALNSMRLEKGYGGWGREFILEYNPFDCGMGRFVKFDKGDFIGREAVLRFRDLDCVPDYKLCFLTVEEGPNNADPIGGEPLMRGDECIGVISSAAYGYTLGKTVALAMVKTDQAVPGSDYWMKIIDEDRQVTLHEKPLFDPQGLKLRQ